MAGNTEADETLSEKPAFDNPPATAEGAGDTFTEAAEEREGGLQAWFSVLGSFLVYFSTFGVVNSFGFFQTFYQQNYIKNASPSAISFIGTLQITLMYFFGSVAGALFDTYGLRYLYPFAAVGGAGSLLATSFTKPNHIWQQFLAQSLLFGLTVSYGVQPALSVTGQYFKRRRALAMGLVASGSSIGGVCLPIMFSKLIPKIGFGWAMRVGALILLVCYAIAICTSKAKNPPKQLKSPRQLLDYRGYLDKRYACLSAGTVVGSFGVYVPYYYIQPYCATLDPNTNITSYLLPMMNAASLLGRIIGGQAADRFGRLNILYPMILLCGILCLAIWLPSASVGVVISFVWLYGFASGIFISVMPAATGQIVPTEKLGSRLGAFGTVTAVAFLTGSPIAGALVNDQSRAGHRPLIIFAGCCLFAGGTIIFIARLLHDRNLKSKW
ncbi:MAG: hypothetical protein M1820_001863 [Bogoriella megaspora]|nr:MAG: hypothetical protein M1820_001863 [Bogoriella megaspora]